MLDTKNKINYITKKTHFKYHMNEKHYIKNYIETKSPTHITPSKIRYNTHVKAKSYMLVTQTLLSLTSPVPHDHEFLVIAQAHEIKVTVPTHERAEHIDLNSTASMK
jgi:hypothetical protein